MEFSTPNQDSTPEDQEKVLIKCRSPRDSSDPASALNIPREDPTNQDQEWMAAPSLIKRTFKCLQLELNFGGVQTFHRNLNASLISEISVGWDASSQMEKKNYNCNWKFHWREILVGWRTRRVSRSHGLCGLDPPPPQNFQILSFRVHLKLQLPIGPSPPVEDEQIQCLRKFFRNRKS